MKALDSFTVLLNGDGFIELVDAHRSRKIDASPRATVLKVWVVKEIPRCIFALMYNLENEDWACALEDKNNDGIYDILLGPGKPGNPGVYERRKQAAFP